jgi:TusA-related sulfurtransferase
MELIRAIRESAVGTVLAVRSTDKGSRTDIPKWVEKAGHRLIGVTERDGYDEIVVEKLR